MKKVTKTVATAPGLKAVLSATPLSQGTFGIGATKAEVRSIQGTPDDVTPGIDWWHYGPSYVDFDDDGRVDGWSNSGRNLRLTVLVP